MSGLHPTYSLGTDFEAADFTDLIIHNSLQYRRATVELFYEWVKPLGYFIIIYLNRVIMNA